jgi:hypothetical protein
MGPVALTGVLEIGRPPGIKPGSDLDTALAVSIAIPLPVGRYRWELEVKEQAVAQEAFEVREGAVR